MNFDSLIKKVCLSGAKNAAVIPVEKIVLDTAFRDMCAANMCGVYGKCWMCPPDMGEIEDLMAQVRKYDFALVFQTVDTLEDSFDYEGMMEARKNIRNLAFKVRDDFKNKGVQNALYLGAGGCGVCNVCEKVNNKPCPYPELAMSSLEAYGINVSQLAKESGMKYINGADTVTYFGAVLFNTDACGVLYDF
ncbi:MAG: DUF2284 domain-containing protein [Clostridia bacterium]|nr:DUF2284 domain-containing protein [Clostridia bacterium]